MTEVTYPKGAIQSVDQVWFGRRLWDVVKSNGFREIEEVTVTRGPVTSECFDSLFRGYCIMGVFWVEFARDSAYGSQIGAASLRDRNIGGHYNNNFLFATEEDALVFLGDDND